MWRKVIIRIGVVLLVITLASLAGTALISVYEGVGGVPIGHSRTGRQGVFIGVAYLPVFLIALVIGCFYVWRQRGRAQSSLRRMLKSLSLFFFKK